MSGPSEQHTYEDVLRDEDVMSFVDNQGALGILVSGSSSDQPMGRLSHEVAKAQQDARSRFFYEYVASAANIADWPSRGELDRSVHVLRRCFRAPVHVREVRYPHLTVVSE